MNVKYIKADCTGTCIGDFQEIYKINYDENLDENTVENKIDSIMEDKYLKRCCSH